MTPFSPREQKILQFAMTCLIANRDELLKDHKDVPFEAFTPDNFPSHEELCALSEKLLATSE